MQSQGQEPTNLEMNLREQLLGPGAPSSTTSSAYPPVPTTSGQEHPYRSSESTSPHDLSAEPSSSTNHHSAAHMSYSMSNDSGADDGLNDLRKGKRELSTSKRAAQNRAAQRAFRQRKEGYIKKLEEQVRDFEQMEKSYRSLQSENYQLREYILNLQSRLLESSSEVPAPPAQVNLQPPTQAEAQRVRRDHEEAEADEDQVARMHKQYQTYPETRKRSA